MMRVVNAPCISPITTCCHRTVSEHSLALLSRLHWGMGQLWLRGSTPGCNSTASIMHTALAKRQLIGSRTAQQVISKSLRGADWHVAPGVHLLQEQV